MQPLQTLDDTMWLILIVLLFVVALAGGGWGHQRVGYWSWSPAAIILIVAAVLYFTGHLSIHLV